MRCIGCDKRNGHSVYAQFFKQSLGSIGIVRNAFDVVILTHVTAVDVGGYLCVAVPCCDDHVFLIDGLCDRQTELLVGNDGLIVLQVEAYEVLRTAGLGDQLQVSSSISLL